MTTSLTLLAERARSMPNKVAFRHHRFGIWEPTTWAQLQDKAALVGAALMSKGVQAGDAVALVGANDPLWVAIDLAILGVGASSVPIDPSLRSTDVVQIVRAASCTLAVAGDQEQFDKLEDARVAGLLPELRMILVVDTRGIRHLDVGGHAEQDRTDSLNGVLGQTSVAPSSWKEAAVKVEPSAVAVRFGDGLSATHSVVLAEGEASRVALSLSAADQLLSQVSFADRIERSISLTSALACGLTVNIGEGGQLGALELNAVQPTLLHVSPQWLAGAASSLEGRIAATKGLKRAALSRGWKPRPVRTVVRKPGIPTLTKLGFLTILLQFVFLLVSVHLHDAIRVLVLLLIALVVFCFAIFSGAAVTGPLRRILGLSRARAVVTGRDGVDGAISDSAKGPGESMLGALDIPLIKLGELS